MDHHRLLALKSSNRVLRLLAGQLGKATVEHRLPAACLTFRKVDYVPQSPQNADHCLAGLRANDVAQAGDHEAEFHGPTSFSRRLQ